ncbi:EamA/RhaT family transporter [Pseudorhizobium halotolerans]|uniref:EamA/RhaT family transporter n=1 Tax=Pseudorhizobium halotolerans TaxID=1233081 RepID=A0ABM8PKS1_9HYPH|nr:DMT family transporter [Pseudorhizobium halotolerans]CAD7035290.1 EamA/RhaT family transporter [Pseudorhizobium halotolerans]
MVSPENTRGALYMSLAMASFTFNDALVKSVTSSLSVAQIITVRGVMTTVLVYFVARRLGALRRLAVVFQPLILLRTFFEIGATLTFISALGQIDFANVTSIMQSLPLAVTLGAAIFLKEPVGWRRWAAILVGFFGVLIILRPTADGFASASLLVVAAVFFTSSRDLVTRRIVADVPSLTITLFTAAANTIVGAFLIVPMGGWQPMTWENFLPLVIAALLVFSGYQAVIMAMRTGEISFVAPFRYTSLIWGLVLGILFFGERPDAFVYVGAAIIIVSGLYSFYREGKRRREAMARSQQPLPQGPTTSMKDGS